MRDATNNESDDDVASWVYEVETGLVELSDRYYTMLGYEPKEFEGTFANLFGLLHADDIAHTTEKFDELFLGKSKEYYNEIRLLNKSGEYTRVLSQGFAVRNEDGLLVRFIGWNKIISSN